MRLQIHNEDKVSVSILAHQTCPESILCTEVSCQVLVHIQASKPFFTAMLHTKMIWGLIPGIGTVPQNCLADYELAWAKSSPGTVRTVQNIYSAQEGPQALFNLPLYLQPAWPKHKEGCRNFVHIQSNTWQKSFRQL